MSAQIKEYINELFVELNASVEEIIEATSSSDMATKQIMACVSSGITAASKGYISTLYSVLSKETLKETIFQDDANANKFYDMNLRQKLTDKYQFNIDSLEAYSKGLEYKEINQLYTSAAVAAGSAAVGGMLLGVLSGVVHLPMVVIIAGAVLAGIGGGGYTYSKYVPSKNKENYRIAVQSFMRDLEEEMLNWVDAVVEYYHQQVDELKKSL